MTGWINLTEYRTEFALNYPADFRVLYPTDLRVLFRVLYRTILKKREEQKEREEHQQRACARGGGDDAGDNFFKGIFCRGEKVEYLAIVVPLGATQRRGQDRQCQPITNTRSDQP